MWRNGFFLHMLPTPIVGFHSPPTFNCAPNFTVLTKNNDNTMATITSGQSVVMPRTRRRRDVTGKIEGRKFVCDNTGCGRSFTRAEHLQRHLLNHSSGEHTCDRCRAHFKRRDLLGKTQVSFVLQPSNLAQERVCITYVPYDHVARNLILLHAHRDLFYLITPLASVPERTELLASFSHRLLHGSTR